MKRLGLASIVVMLAGCWVPAETGQRMQADIKALQTQQSASQKGLDEQRARLDEQMQRAEKKIDEVQKAIEEFNRAARSTDADFGVQLDRLIKELQELRGTTELTDFRLKQIEGKLEGEGSLSARLATMEQAQTKAAEKATAPLPPAAASANEPPKGKKELLAYADKLLKEKNVADARGVWREVIKKWPSEAGVTDQAYYALGESYYDEKKYRSALQEYVNVVEKFATGSYADDAYYKIGLCSMEIGNYEDAKIFFSEIVKNYKKSPLLKDAQKKLEEVGKQLEKEAKSKKKK